jgi:HK97 family phage portal protein
MNILGINLPTAKASTTRINAGEKFRGEIDAKNAFIEALTRYGGGEFTLNPQNDGTNYITQAYQYNDTVFSILSYIIEMAGSIPWVVYEKKDSSSKKYIRMKGEAKLGGDSQIWKNRGLREVTIPELEKLMKRPNPLTTWPELIGSMIGFKKLTGNSYTYKIKPEDGPNKNFAGEIWTLPSQNVRIVGGGPMQPISHFNLTFDKEAKFQPDEILHLKNWNPVGFDSRSGEWLYGMSTIQANSRTILRNNQSISASINQLANSGAKGILSDETLDDFGSTGLTDTQYEELEKKYYAKYGNVKNLGKILITAGKWKWTQIGLSPVDLAILDSEKWDAAKIANSFRFPSELLNHAQGGTLNGSTRQEANKQFYLKCLIPDLDVIANGLNNFIVEDFGEQYYIEPDYQAIQELQKDMKDMTDWLDKWWIPGDRKLEYMGWETTGIPEMQVPILPSGGTPLIDYGKTDPANPSRIAAENDPQLEKAIQRMKDRLNSGY